LESYKNDLLVEKVPFYPDNNINGFVVVYLEEITQEAIYVLNQLGIIPEYLC
jgi:hypothetical protein